jgi:MerR family transcriptional regulator, repressor of the yfmOP operon
MRIGALAKAAGTTVRTVRYYEEIGLLPAADERSAGAHREYGEEDVERLRELLRLKGLLGLSLEELREVMVGEDARAARRRAWQETSDPDDRARILSEGLAYTESLLELVRRRRADLESFEAELCERRRRQAHLLRALARV